MPPAFPTEVQCAWNLKQANASFTFQQLIKLFKPKTSSSDNFQENIFFPRVCIERLFLKSAKALNFNTVRDIAFSYQKRTDIKHTTQNTKCNSGEVLKYETAGGKSHMFCISF